MIDLPASNSRAMRAYMQAILEVTGLTANQSFPLELFMENYRTHLSPKAKFPHATLRKNPDGMYSLTQQGARFFSSRLTPEPIVRGQKVSRDEVLEMVRNILAIEPPDGWKSFAVEFSANA